MAFAILYVVGLIIAGHLIFFFAEKDWSNGERVVATALWPVLLVLGALFLPLEAYYKKILVPAKARAEKARWDKKNKEALEKRKVV